VLVFRTRTKVITSKPIYNAGPERFISDWRNAIVTLSVRDARKREHDPLLGVVCLKLSNVFQTSSQVTAWYPISSGLGYGRARVSLLFRSVDLQIPKQLQGWDVGTFEFQEGSLQAVGAAPGSRVVLLSDKTKARIPRSKAKSEGSSVQWSFSAEEIRLPVHHRYMSPILFQFFSRNITKPNAYAVLWLRDLIDNEWTDLELCLFNSKNPDRYQNNYFPREFEDFEDLEKIGKLRFKARFKTGLDYDHKALAESNDENETMETYEACLSAGFRGNIVKRETNQVIDRLQDGDSVDSDSDISDEDNENLQEEEERTHAENEQDDALQETLSKNTEKRKHRGIMQSKLVRNLKFAKDELIVGKTKIKDKISLNNRTADVETEIE